MRQIPAIEAKNILVAVEGTLHGSGESTPESKKRLQTLQRLAREGVKE